MGNGSIRSFIVRCAGYFPSRMAWHYKQYARDQASDERGAYAEAEVAARDARAGLWHDVAPVAPWEWRHKK